MMITYFAYIARVHRWAEIATQARLAAIVSRQRLITAGDRLLPPCSHMDSVPTYDARCPPWRFAPPVALTCLTCNAVIPAGSATKAAWRAWLK